MDRIPIVCVNRQFNGHTFHLEITDNAATLIDAYGEVFDVIPIDEAPQRMKLPSFSQSIKHLHIMTHRGEYRFDVKRADREPIRRFLEHEITSGGSDALRSYRNKAIVKLIVGPIFTAIGLIVTITSMYMATTGQSEMYAILYGLLVVGLVLTGDGIYQLVRLGRVKRSMESRDPEPFNRGD